MAGQIYSTGFHPFLVIFHFGIYFQGITAVNLNPLRISNQNQNPYRHSLNLDNLNGRYRMDRLVDWKEKRVIFNVTVETTGFICFGLSKTGEVEGADIIIGGVHENGEVYFTDRHETGRGPPQLDPSQDWTLHNAWERRGITFLSFSRPFDTCDEEHDIPITNDYLAVIWAFGETDDANIQPKEENSGKYDVYLLDPDLAPDSLQDSFSPGPPNPNDFLNVFQITTSVEMTGEDTKYWCSFHKAPTSNKQHIIGYNTVFPSDFDRRHVHHLLLFRCRVPGRLLPDAFFADAVNRGGNSCLTGSGIGGSGIEVASCGELIHAWGYGGRAIFFPDHVGIPMSETGTEYFMFQTHFDNPDLLTNVNVTVSLEVFYGNKIRENEAGVALIGQVVPGSVSLLLPPNSQEHIIMGHCAAGCTSEWIPPEGISIFATFLHTHTSGRGVRFQHFRGDKELPWILSDDNFNFNYQPARLLREERRVLSGDQLIQRCVYDTTNKNGSAVVGGHSTRHEMCMAFAYFYTRIPGFSACTSELRTREYTELVGIQNTTFDTGRRETVITQPIQYSGLSVSNYATNYIDWDGNNGRMRKELQNQQILQPHAGFCINAVRGATSTQANAVNVRVSRFRDDIPPFTPAPRCVKEMRRGSEASWSTRKNGRNMLLKSYRSFGSRRRDKESGASGGWTTKLRW
ncbi:unnamed protein product [Orchesella dallaii]|uniref:DOMON domain-containing protein n=1 Tax=Orchesella dallaii TaxID=48710 RepID=A0ABP1PIA9_9HEXA